MTSSQYLRRKEGVEICSVPRDVGSEPSWWLQASRPAGKGPGPLLPRRGGAWRPARPGRRAVAEGPQGGDRRPCAAREPLPCSELCGVERCCRGMCGKAEGHRETAACVPLAGGARDPNSGSWGLRRRCKRHSPREGASPDAGISCTGSRKSRGPNSP